MDPFPQEWELLSLFECEPTLEDVGVPWVYNRLTFASQRDGDRIRCVIEPGYRCLSFDWHHHGDCRLSLDLHRVHSLEVISDAGTDAMRVSFRDPQLSMLTIQLRPVICCHWGMTRD